MRYFSNKFSQLFLVAFALFFGLGLGQFPQFLAQYLQRLGGHIDEAKLLSEKFDVDGIQERVFLLEEGLNKIEDAGVLMKLPSFLRHADWDIVDRTLENFTRGMTFDKIGMIYCITGAVIGIIIFDLFSGAFNLFFGRRKKKEKEPKVTEPTPDKSNSTTEMKETDRT